MVMTSSDLAKRIGYGATFLLGVPILLLLWARLSAAMTPLPAIGSPLVGWAVAVAGAALLVAGVVGLIRHGHGLPMNAFPPPRFVREGIFHWLRNPIYLGFGLVVLGAALATRSPSGLWLVTPATWLAMAALVFGYERHDLRRRFGSDSPTPARFSVPRPDEGTPNPVQRLATLVWVFGPWLLAYFAVQGLGRPPDAISTQLPGEGRWPVWPWMELPYLSAYLLVPLAVLAARSNRALSSLAVSGLVGTVVVTLCWLVVPVVASHRPFAPNGWLASLLAAEQSHSAGVAAFPAFHVLWPMLAARAASAGRGRLARAAIWAMAALIIASSVGTGHHTVVEAAAGLALYWPLRDLDRTWALIRRATERFANSWREWRVGPLRFISHGWYAGAAAGVGVLVAGSTAGAGHERAVAWVGAWILLGAAAYAQALEGSPRLLRPFGWYGGLLGGLVGVLSSPVVGGAIMPVMAAFALAAPWIQVLGRLRCLVQGCCHGDVAPPAAGIRYRHPRSRVAGLANLAGVPIYPTPLYSIAGNLVIAVALIRLRTLVAPDSLLVGVYFLLSGCARFVEESYRGEPQTPMVLGLRVYQWFAVALVLAGIGCAMLPMAPSRAGIHAPSGALLGWAVAMFLVFAAAMGLDFPGSDRRFARLASAD